tara:strand:- start:177 stop:506 length:330 start_codon:yes stop_codon:yes gene_type:complete
MGILESNDVDRETVEVEVVVFEGLESAMLGVTVVDPRGLPRAVYDLEKAIDVVALEMGIVREEAALLVYDNCVRIADNGGHPLFISRSKKTGAMARSLTPSGGGFGFSH